MAARPPKSLPIVDADRAEPMAGANSSGTGSPLPSTVPPSTAPASTRTDLWDRVRAILDLIRPAVQEDGGDVELVTVTEDGQVQVRFHGACVGCPSSSITLQTGIERNLRDHVAEVTSVIAVP